MKLSQNMLNFLGYLSEKDNKWCDYKMANGLAYELGIKAALKNGLIIEKSHGYVLTQLGKEIGAIGKRMRQEGKDSVYVAMGQLILDSYAELKKTIDKIRAI